jgi:hypothetical protein
MKSVWEAVSALIMAGVLALPMWAVKGLVIAVLAGMGGWAMRMPRQYAMKGAPGDQWYYDVRYWAVAVIVCEIIPYLVF